MTDLLAESFAAHGSPGMLPSRSYLRSGPSLPSRTRSEIVAQTVHRGMVMVIHW